MAHKVTSGCADVEFLVMGALENNVYIISDGQATFVVDPSCNADEIVNALAGKKLDAIVLTHRHYDHVGAAFDLREKTGAQVIASKIDAEIICGNKPLPAATTPFQTCPVDRRVQEGDVLELGEMKWQVIETPGHTQGSMCLFLPSRSNADEGECPILISGDTLFFAATGRTDFPGGSVQQMRASLQKLSKLPDRTIVLTGHNNLTTIGAERKRVFEVFA